MTGGGSGIGAATCRRLAGEGARVAVTDLSIDSAREVAEDIDGRAYQLDVRSEVEAASVLEQAEAELGPLDALVNNAGVRRVRLLHAAPSPTGGTESSP